MKYYLNSVWEIEWACKETLTIYNVLEKKNNSRMQTI